jgi:OmpA-OmpF porin, OOP family
MWGLHTRYQFTPEDALQLNYSHLEFENTDINARVIDLMYLNRINEGDKFTPFLGIGAGVADMANISPYHDGLKFASRARAGVEYAVTDDLVASLYADYHFIGKMPFNSVDEENEDESFPGREIFAVIPQVGLTYFFGPDKEIEDKKEPSEKNIQPVVPVNTSQLDDDKDGIINLNDKCPETLQGQTVNDYGCMKDEKLSMRLEVLFPTGQRELNSEANSHLNSLAEFMNEHPETKLEVQGHTDNVGSSKINKEISEERAMAIKEFLVEEAGINPSRINVYGHGERKPLRENSTPEGRAENRRAVGVITQ